MNVQEELLQETIDPNLNDTMLSSIATAALGERVAVRGYEILTGGCWNRVVGVVAGNMDLVIKISPHASDQKIIREFSVLETFAEKSQMPVPVPLLLDGESNYTPGTLLVMTRIPGVPMHQCFGTLQGKQRTQISVQIARHLSLLHNNRTNGFGGVELPADQRCEEWSDFWLPRLDEVVDAVDASGSAPRRLIDGTRAVRPQLKSLLEIGPQSTMTHYDIWSGNVMIDMAADPPVVSGFIDVPGHYADYARELSFAMLFGVADRAFFDTYTQGHDIDTGFGTRSAIYNLKMNLKHIQMYPTEQYYQSGAAECLREIENTLDT